MEASGALWLEMWLEGWLPGRWPRNWVKQLKLATSPFHCALSTKTGCECIAHALQALTEANPEATILSVDGIGAFDLVSRGAMLQGLCDVSPSAVLFVRQFHGSPSRYLWEDDCGEVHDIIDQREGGEQGDPLMPMFFSLGQHNALRAVQARTARWRTHFRVFSMMFTSSVPQRGCQPSTPSCRKSCGDTRGCESIMGRRKCGTCLATAPSVATFWTEQLAHWIQNSPQCGEEEESQRTKAL